LRRSPLFGGLVRLAAFSYVYARVRNDPLNQAFHIHSCRKGLKGLEGQCSNVSNTLGNYIER